MLNLLIAILFFLLTVKSVSFWIYLWQLKEYRFDRFFAEYRRFLKLIRLWFGTGGRKFWRPVLTNKAIGIFLFSIVTIQLFAVVLPDRTDIARTSILTYLLAPFFVSLIVFLFKIPTFFIKKFIYSRAASKIRGMKNLLVIGITGSYGKSSTKEFLYQILSLKFKVAKTPLNVNSEIGVARFIIKDLPSDAEIFIVEMGAYKRGEIRGLSKIIRPKIGILTGISEQHLALFGSIENIKKAKFELIESLPPDGLAVFNGENKYSLELAEKWKGKGIIYRADYFQEFKNIPRHYELNLNAAINVAKYLGMSKKEIDEAVEKLSLSGNMIKSFSGKNNTLIIDDTYSANPDGVLAALDYLKTHLGKTKIIIMPCLIELGEASHRVHSEIGRKIKAVCDLAIILTPDYFLDIKKEAVDKAVLESDPEKVMALLKNKLNENTVILLEGRMPSKIVDMLKE